MSEFFGANEILARAASFKFRLGIAIVDLLRSRILWFSPVISGVANLSCGEERFAVVGMVSDTVFGGGPYSRADFVVETQVSLPSDKALLQQGTV